MLRIANLSGQAFERPGEVGEGGGRTVALLVGNRRDGLHNLVFGQTEISQPAMRLDHLCFGAELWTVRPGRSCDWIDVAGTEKTVPVWITSRRVARSRRLRDRSYLSGSKSRATPTTTTKSGLGTLAGIVRAMPGACVRIAVALFSLIFLLFPAPSLRRGVSGFPRADSPICELLLRQGSRKPAICRSHRPGAEQLIERLARDGSRGSARSRQTDIVALDRAILLGKFCKAG